MASPKCTEARRLNEWRTIEALQVYLSSQKGGYHQCRLFFESSLWPEYTENFRLLNIQAFLEFTMIIKSGKLQLSFIHSTVTEECKMINTTHRIPTLFHYDIKLKHTFSQILQQEIFLNSTQTKIKTTSCQILPSATIPAWAPMPTGFQIPPAFAHTLPTAPRRHPRTTTSPKFTSPSSHKRQGDGNTIYFGCPNGNSKTTFISPTSPKSYEITFCFKRLPLWDGIWYFFGHFTL